MSVLILIPARGGSKGLPGKNLREIDGISLVGRAARSAIAFADAIRPEETFIHLDTDSMAIAEEGKRWGISPLFLRPAHLAQDSTSTVDSVLYSVETLSRLGRECSTIVLLQPTSPLRSLDDVTGCWHLFKRHAQPVVSLVREDHPPEFCVRLEADGAMRWAFTPITTAHRRQDFPASYRPNGAVYVVSRDFLQRERSFFDPATMIGYPMLTGRSVDIDAEEDLAIAETLAKRGASVPNTPFGSRPFASRPRLVARLGGEPPDRQLELVRRLALMGVEAVLARPSNASIVDGVHTANRSAAGVAGDGGRFLDVGLELDSGDSLPLGRSTRPVIACREDRLPALLEAARDGSLGGGVLVTMFRDRAAIAPVLNGAARAVTRRGAALQAVLEVESNRDVVDAARRAEALTRALGLPVGVAVSGDDWRIPSFMEQPVPFLVCDAQQLVTVAAGMGAAWGELGERKCGS